MNKRFLDHVAVITGGTQGIGFAVAEALVHEGAAVAILGRDREKGKDAEMVLSKKGGDVMFISCDVADPESTELAIEQVVKKFGKLDLAFNNAGISPKRSNLHLVEPGDFQRVIDVNLNGIFNSMRSQIAAMSQRGGAIVNNSSVAGLTAIPGQVAYVASKFGVVGITQAAAIEYAQGTDESPLIRVNAIAPGPVMGGMNSPDNLARNPERTRKKVAVTAMKRFGEADEIANTVLWLLSKDASYITGATIPVDGGTVAGKAL